MRDLAGLAELGRYFGFKHCCVEAFCGDFMHGRSPAQTRLIQCGSGEWDGTGFVPCCACSASIKRLGMREYVRQAMAKRICPFPFGSIEAARASCEWLPTQFREVHG
jgi:hypothetical protein